jgi:tetratricopeptide (TPR) repeat protein
MAYMHKSFGQPELAITEFDKAFKLGLIGKVKRATALFERAECYWSLKKPALALADCNEAIKLEPNDVLARKDRAVTLIQLHRYNEALVEFAAALEVSRKYAPSWTGRILLLRADLHRTMGRNDLAILDERDSKYSQAAEFNLIPFRTGNHQLLAPR